MRPGPDRHRPNHCISDRLRPVSHLALPELSGGGCGSSGRSHARRRRPDFLLKYMGSRLRGNDDPTFFPRFLSIARMSRSAFYALFIASGFAGLIYESVWTHYLKLFLGHAAYAQSLVLAVFMGGMAAGAAWCARRSARFTNPLAVYAAVEAVVGLASLAFHPVFAVVTDWSYEWLLPGLGGETLALGAKLAVSCALILPQSVLLGMTFPLMSAGLARAHRGSAGESLSMLYFTNSLGAAAGVLASGFVLIAWIGLPGTLRTAGGLNLLIAAVVWVLARPARHRPIRPASDADSEAAPVLL